MATRCWFMSLETCLTRRVYKYGERLGLTLEKRLVKYSSKACPILFLSVSHQLCESRIHFMELYLQCMSVEM